MNKIGIADPNILLHKGTYYLYGTDEKRGATEGNPVYTSTDLKNWEEQSIAFSKGKDTWSQRHFWGAEVIQKGDKFLMYYCCSHNMDDREPLNMHLAAAVSDSPLGPFKELRAPLYKPQGKDEAIDQNIFVDNDGKAYLFFVRVVIGSHNEIQVVKLKENYLDFDGEPETIIRPEKKWESNEWDGHKVAEAPFAFKHGDYYYLLYTCNHFLDEKYAIGFATSKSPMGPWKKYDNNPILQKRGNIPGPGNASLIKSADGNDTFIVYHTHNKPGQVSPRLLKIDRVEFISSGEGKPDIISIVF